MKLTKAFTCVPPGEIYPRVLASGEECPAEYEESARIQGCLDAPLDKFDHDGDGKPGGSAKGARRGKKSA